VYNIGISQHKINALKFSPEWAMLLVGRKQAMNKIFALVSVFGLVACGQAQDSLEALTAPKAPTATPAPTVARRTVALPEETTARVSVMLKSATELPECSSANEASLAYLIDEAGFVTCSAGEWLSVSIKGAAGEHGAKGDKGDKGDRGEAGAPGAQGAQGTRGETGLQGLQGVQGARGETGATGATGSTGAQGVAGIDGQDGTDNRIASNQFCVHASGNDILQFQVAATVAGDVFVRVSRSTLTYANTVDGWFKAGETPKVKMYWNESGTLAAYTYQAQWNSLGNLELMRCRYGTDCTGGSGALYGCMNGQ
jgi:hypothetical protein